MPLTTLEVGTAPGVPYTGYWAQFAEAKLTDPASIKKARELGSYVTRLAEAVLQEVNPYGVVLLPDMVTGEPQEQTISNGVAEWYRTLGSFNPLDNAQGDLLRGAGLLLQTNVNENQGRFKVPVTSSDEVYDRFTSLTDRNAPEAQKPNRDLLLAAQLVHTAAWTEPDAGRQHTLFASAEQMYGRIRNSKYALWVDRLLAGQYRSDIRFHWLGEDMRHAVKYGEQERLADLQGVARGLLRQQVADLNQARGLLALADKSRTEVGGWDGQHWAGFMLECFAMIAMRDLMYVRSRPSLTARYEVRRAFQHEDMPRTSYLRPKQSFDLVVSRRDVQGVISGTTPIQFKLYKEGGKPKGGCEEDFTDEITYIAVCGIQPKEMIRATNELLIAYAEQDLQRGEGPLAVLQKLCGGVLDERILAAAVQPAA